MLKKKKSRRRWGCKKPSTFQLLVSECSNINTRECPIIGTGERSVLSSVQVNDSYPVLGVDPLTDASDAVSRGKSYCT